MYYFHHEKDLPLETSDIESELSEPPSVKSKLRELERKEAEKERLQDQVQSLVRDNLKLQV